MTSPSPVYPEDVQKALDQAAEQGWPIECYQAALAIALGHLEQAPPPPEVVLMWAEEDITYLGHGLRYRADGNGDNRYEYGEVELRVQADTVYLVCPVCLSPTSGHWMGPAIESATLDLELQSDGELTAWRGDYDTTSEGSEESYLVCQNRHCYARLGIPAWLSFDD